MIQKFFAARNARASQSAVNRSSAIAEVLESRIQLSANEILVNTAVDENDGPGVGTGTSLREAVELANNDANIDTIRFAASLDGVTLFLEGQQYGQMTITQPLSIIGNGPENTVINGQRQSRIFDIPKDVGEVSFEGMTLTKGMTTEDGTTSGAQNLTGGAAIRAGRNTNILISNCYFFDNKTLGLNAFGGAIFSSETVSVDNSEFEFNSTRGGDADGGAIWTYILTCTNSLFVNNLTTGNASKGGAIGGGTIVSTNSDFISNRTYGISSSGGAIGSSQVIRSQSNFHDNSTKKDEARGGAIQSTFGDIQDSAFTNNYTIGAGGAGGALAFLHNETFASIKRCVFE
ncbi:MAG: hypothetical protein KDA78_09190 [Planctomycetaceae bacterium]|nr:hypothetical protein [Planctomycetaceae bacterium]